MLFSILILRAFRLKTGHHRSYGAPRTELVTQYGDGYDIYGADR